MDWDDLRVFLAVAREGSVRGAARKIGKTHATVSRHVRSLEGALGNPLFERLPGGQNLTGLGERILPLAETVETQVGAIDRVAFAQDTGLAGPVRVSLPETLYMAVLSAPMDDFLQRFPMIDVTIMALDQISNLAQREADVVIRITDKPPETAVGRKVASSPLALFASPAYLARRPALDRWVSYNYQPADKPILPARIVARGSSAAVSAELMRQGQGMGLLPCYMGDRDPGLCRVPDFAVIPDKDVWVLTPADLRSNPRVRALMDHLYEAFENCKALIEGRIPNITKS